MNDDDDSAIVGWIIWALVTMFIFVVFMDWYGYMMDIARNTMLVC